MAASERPASPLSLAEREESGARAPWRSPDADMPSRSWTCWRRNGQHEGRDRRSGRAGADVRGRCGRSRRAKAVVADVVAAHGRLDVLINNAGRSMATGILEITEEQFDATIAVNLKSCFNYIQAAAPHMLAREWGRIVSMSSLNAHSGGVTAAVSRFAYASAKAGIIGMTRALAKELGPRHLPSTASARASSRRRSARTPTCMPVSRS